MFQINTKKMNCKKSKSHKLQQKNQRKDYFFSNHYKKYKQKMTGR